MGFDIYGLNPKMNTEKPEILVKYDSLDNKWKDISSLVLLEKSRDVIAEYGYQIVNTDATIVAQQPRLTPHIEAMTIAIARTLKIDPDQVNVKATTTEHLGFVGREEGIAAYGVVLLQAK